LPRKTAQPPLVGKTARTCTSMTVLFIEPTVPGLRGKTRMTEQSDTRAREALIYFRWGLHVERTD
jgi:hypothetical protein